MAALTLSPYYKEAKTNNYLSKTFESSILHTPGDTQRRTISQENYLRRRFNEPPQFKTPWGRKYSYGGMSIMRLPPDNRPLDDPPLPMHKGSLHFGSGVCANPRGVPIRQYYENTLLQKSNVRPTDELIPPPGRVDLSTRKCESSIPQESTYASHHPPKQQIFQTCDDVTHDIPLSAETPASAPVIGIREKTRGSYGRHEVISIPLNSQRQPMIWPDTPSYYKILKGSNREKRVYYPVPSDENRPSLYYSAQTHPNTAKALRQLKISQWQTTYQRDYDRLGKPYLNLDSEETLLKISGGPNATVVKSLMNSNFTENEPRSVEELSGAAQRKDRAVHFERLHPYDNGEVTSDTQCCEENKTASGPNKVLLRPIFKDHKTFASFVSSNERESLQKVTKDAYQDITKPISGVNELPSRTEFIRKFNVKYYNKDKSNLYDEVQPRSNSVPQKDYIKSAIFS